jgi:uncharacterized protein
MESPFKVNLHELPRRAGEHKSYSLNFPAPEAIGNPLLEIPAGEFLEISFEAESVADGVLISGSVRSHAKGECGRCLEKISEDIDQKFQELFFYENRIEESDDDLFVMDGDFADIETPIRDAVVLAMPINPLCKADCRGLCSECGEKLELLEPGHMHEKIDPRWSGLSGWQPK